MQLNCALSQGVEIIVAGKLGELLVSNGIVDEGQLASARDYQKNHKVRLGAALVSLGHTNENVLATFLSKIYGIPAISLEQASVSKEVTELIPRNFCERNGLIPMHVAEGVLHVAISDPTNVAAVDDIRFLSNMDVAVHISTESAIRDCIDRFYSSIDDPGRAIKDVFKNENIESGKTSAVEVNASAAEAVEVESASGSDKPVIRLINVVLLEAIKRKASDVHFEPMVDGTRIRLRIDGSLHSVMKVPKEMRHAVPARIKVMSNLDISERRLPQDGRIQVKTKRKKIDVRVSILPTVVGEKVVMRILDQGDTPPSLEKIGFEEVQRELFWKAAEQPYGMVLVTGPTGSGKSTTLFAALSALNDPDINISTVEDPVEYRLTGVNQTQMKSDIGLNFASALRSLLRQDPDLIMVGEIRDQETAEIAVKSALTGHMVFSTLHTNDAPSTVTRLVHMGIEPFLITAALTLVQAQRLIRVNCKHCLIEDSRVTQEQLIAAEMPEHWLESFSPMRGKGCERCAKTGYKGRKGIFEVMAMSEELRSMVIKGANADELKRCAVDGGMLTLRQAGLLKLYRGETTLEEVLNNSRPDGDI